MRGAIFLSIVLPAIPLGACTTTYYPGPDPVPVIGAQLIGSSGGCVDVQDGGTADGTPVNLYHCHGSPNERWFIGRGRISESFGSCLDVQGGVAAEAAPLILNACNGSPSQHWSVSDGKVVGVGDKCIDAAGAADADFTPLILVTCKAVASQQWTVQ
jgi:hypothetical protein